MTLAELVHACAPGADAAVEVVPVEAVEPGFPLVLGDPSYDIMARRRADAARAVGLTATPLETTAADVLAWDRERGEPPLARELSREREAELLAAADR